MGERYEIANTIFDLERKNAAQKSRCFINIFKFLFGISGAADITEYDDIFNKDINMNVTNQHKMLLYLKSKLSGIIGKAVDEQKREDKAKKNLELITTQPGKSGTASPIITTQPEKSSTVSPSNPTTIITTQPTYSDNAHTRSIKEAKKELKNAKGDIKYRKCCWWELTGNLKTHQFIDIYLKKIEDPNFLKYHGKDSGQRISYLLFDRIAAFILCFGSKNQATDIRDYYGWYFPNLKSIWADGLSVELEKKKDIDKENVTRKREEELEEIMFYDIEPQLILLETNPIIELIGKIEYLIKNPFYEDDGIINEKDFMARLNVLKEGEEYKKLHPNLYDSKESKSSKAKRSPSKKSLVEPPVVKTPVVETPVVETPGTKKQIARSLRYKLDNASNAAASSTTPEEKEKVEGIKRKKSTKKKRKPKRKKTKNKKKKPKRKTKQSNN